MTMEHAEHSEERTEATPESATEMLDEVHRHLVQIHAAMAERTSSDRQIKPWAQRELMGVIREIGAFLRARRDVQDSGTAAPASSPLSR
jgi:hypothetical protein